VGVFANPTNAEELRSKLTAAGIPTQVETRVQVGPFNNRKEAVAAQARLKALGMDSGMVVTGRH
jgi:DedD protein